MEPLSPQRGIQPSWGLLWSCSAFPALWFGADPSEPPFLAGLADKITPHSVCEHIPFEWLISGQVCIPNCRVLLQKMHQQQSKGTFQRRESHLDPPFPLWNLGGHWCVIQFWKKELEPFSPAVPGQERAGKDRNIIPTGRICSIYFLISWTEVSALPSWFWPCSQGSGSPHILYRMLKCLAKIWFYWNCLNLGFKTESFIYKDLEINNVQWWAQHLGNYSAGIYSCSRAGLRLSPEKWNKWIKSSICGDVSFLMVLPAERKWFLWAQGRLPGANQNCGNVSPKELNQWAAEVFPFKTLMILIRIVNCTSGFISPVSHHQTNTA